MANCPNCNNDITEGSQICINCGARFDNGENEAPVNPNGNPRSTNPGSKNPGNSNSSNNSPAKNVKDIHNDQTAENNTDSLTDLTSTGEGVELATNSMADSRPIDDVDPAEGTPSQPAPTQSNSTGATRNKWLEEQDKIKSELEALKGKITTEFKMEADFGPPEEEDIFTLDDNNFQDIKDASIGLGTLQRPLTPEEEQKKDELLLEINDLKKEGFDVSRLERIVGVDPTGAWKEFVKFMDDIETLQKLRARYSELNTTGFEIESESIRNKLDNPDLTHQIERELNQLEEKISLGVTDGDDGGLRELIDAGKDAFKHNEYQKALNFYKSALKIDPNNREVEFYKRKTEAKLQAMSGMTTPETAEAVAPIPASHPAPAPMQAAPAPHAPIVRQKGKRPAVMRPGAPKLKVRPKAPVIAPAPAPTPPSQIPTGGNVEVKQPLSVSMTPKLPNKKATAPMIKQGGPAMKVKGKKFQLKKPGAAPPPAAAPPAAPPPATTPAKVTDNPAEVEALGFNSFINKEYDKALEYYEQVLAIDPNFPGAAAQRDKCLEALGQK